MRKRKAMSRKKKRRTRPRFERREPMLKNK
jgi:hypothetical protein